MCGENKARPSKRAIKNGASPRVWGEPKPKTLIYLECRSIPTCVGRTLHRLRRGGGGTEHPHVCGENLALKHNVHYRTGASPRVWGEQNPRRLRFQKSRSIPTCVGRTRRRRSRDASASEHPHVCGENVKRAESSRNLRGASPRVWGELRRFNPFDFRKRSIPTCVGRTMFRPVAVFV